MTKNGFKIKKTLFFYNLLFYLNNNSLQFYYYSKLFSIRFIFSLHIFRQRLHNTLFILSASFFPLVAQFYLFFNMMQIFYYPEDSFKCKVYYYTLCLVIQRQIWRVPSFLFFSNIYYNFNIKIFLIFFNSSTHE